MKSFACKLLTAFILLLPAFSNPSSAAADRATLQAMRTISGSPAVCLTFDDGYHRDAIEDTTVHSSGKMATGKTALIAERIWATGMKITKTVIGSLR